MAELQGFDRLGTASKRLAKKERFSGGFLPREIPDKMYDRESFWQGKKGRQVLCDEWVRQDSCGAFEPAASWRGRKVWDGDAPSLPDGWQIRFCWEALRGKEEGREFFI